MGVQELEHTDSYGMFEFEFYLVCLCVCVCVRVHACKHMIETGFI